MKAAMRAGMMRLQWWRWCCDAKAKGRRGSQERLSQIDDETGVHEGCDASAEWQRAGTESRENKGRTKWTITTKNTE